MLDPIPPALQYHQVAALWLSSGQDRSGQICRAPFRAIRTSESFAGLSDFFSSFKAANAVTVNTITPQTVAPPMTLTWTRVFPAGESVSGESRGASPPSGGLGGVAICGTVLNGAEGSGSKVLGGNVFGPPNGKYHPWA